MGIEKSVTSDRIIFMYSRNDLGLENALTEIESIVGDFAYVFSIQEAIKNKLWPELREENIEKFVERIGDAVIIPKGKNVIELKKEEKQKIDPLVEEVAERRIKGRHGGLTKNELFTPLIKLL